VLRLEFGEGQVVRYQFLLENGYRWRQDLRGRDLTYPSDRAAGPGSTPITHRCASSTHQNPIRRLKLTS
jgi:hypothetical protein